MLATLTLPALALDDDACGGFSADTLTIKIGYFGGPYFEKHVFTLDELWDMDVVKADYTFIDNMPSVIIDHVAGVRLSDLMDAAGIDLNSVETFYFWTKDKQSSYYTAFKKTALVDTPRYCYYSLPDNFDDETGQGNDYAISDGESVDTLIALADDWNRCIAGASFGSDYLNLSTDTRFRLIFGQTNGYEHTASRSAKWIHEIVVELGGAPTVTLDASVLEGKVGSVLRTEAAVEAADPAIAAGEKVTWSTSDPSVAAVDENGAITVRGKGTATITASVGGASASVTVNGTPGDPKTDLPGIAGASGEQHGGQSGGSGKKTAPETAPTPAQPLRETDTPEKNLRPIQPKTKTETTEGGVQNWRVYEMDPASTALPNIELANPLLAITGWAALALLLLSAIAFAVKFKRDVGR